MGKQVLIGLLTVYLIMFVTALPSSCDFSSVYVFELACLEGIMEEMGLFFLRRISMLHTTVHICLDLAPREHDRGWRRPRVLFAGYPGYLCCISSNIVYMLEMLTQLALWQDFSPTLKAWRSEDSVEHYFCSLLSFLPSAGMLSHQMTI